MKKSEQLTINNEVLQAIEKFNSIQETVLNVNRLDYCNACIKETNSYYILQSYNTDIAFIDKATGVLYDVLRYVYGYTATSGKHISKFRRYYRHEKELTFRYV